MWYTDFGAKEPALKRLIPMTAMIASALTGCVAPGTLDLGGLTDQKSVKGSGGRPASNRPLEPLAGVQFRPISAANARIFSEQGGGLNASAPRAEAAVSKAAPAAGLASDATTSSSPRVDGASPAIGGAYSGNVWGGLGYQYHYGMDTSRQMSLVSAQEAEISGSSGGFTEALAVTAPVVKEWASDARLTESRSLLNDTDSRVPVAMPGVSTNAVTRALSLSVGSENEGWRFVYVSSSRNEMLQFVVLPEKTTVLRLAWAPLDLSPERVKFDAQTAITNLINAVSEATFQSEEEKSRKDYFFGHEFIQPNTGEWDNENQKTEVLYRVPEQARWNVSLQQVVGKLVWDINWYATENVAPEIPGVTPPANPPGDFPEALAPSDAVSGSESSPVATMPVAASAQATYRVFQSAARDVALISPEVPVPCEDGKRQQVGVYTNNGGQGLVDAETGAVIRFTRPTRVTNTWYNYDCEPPVKPIEPMPLR